MKQALKQCHCPEWAFTKDPKPRNARTSKPNRRHVVALHVAGLPEKFRRAFFFTSTTTLCTKYTMRRRLVHPEDQIPKHLRSDPVYAVSEVVQARKKNRNSRWGSLTGWHHTDGSGETMTRKNNNMGWTQSRRAASGAD